jgi:hypothetical protein
MMMLRRDDVDGTEAFCWTGPRTSTWSTFRPVIGRSSVDDHVHERWTNGKVLGTSPNVGGQPWGFEKCLLTRDDGPCRVCSVPVSARQPGHRAGLGASGTPATASRERRIRSGVHEAGAGAVRRWFACRRNPTGRPGGGGRQTVVRRVGPVRRNGRSGDKRNRPPELAPTGDGIDRHEG